jgi:hypothetical protein
VHTHTCFILEVIFIFQIKNNIYFFAERENKIKS